MSETKDLLARLKEVGTAIKHVFKPESTTKVLDQQTVEKELNEFTKINGYDANDPNFDIEKFQAEFVEFLKQKGYAFEGIEASLVLNQNSTEEVIHALKKVRKVSEDLNYLTPYVGGVPDTTKIEPGQVYYIIEQIAPCQTKPYVTYRPSPRIIKEIHANGVNGGTIFFTYNHKITKNQDFNGESYVVAEEQVLYSPLNKARALYACMLFTIQSKQVYTKYLKEKAKQEKLKLATQQQIQY